MEARQCRLDSRMRKGAIVWTFGLLAMALLCALSAQPARASFYDVVFCAGGSDAGNPTLGARPGWFDFGTHCEWAVSYPSGGNSNEYLRLSANTSSGSAGYNDEASMSWYTPPWVSIVAGGGYTREPADFNQGWRARFWAEDWGGGVHNILLQGTGIEGTGSDPWITKNTTSTFAAHLWPFGGWDDFSRFVFALWCVKADGCSRAGFVAADANTITLVANDKKGPEVGFVDSSIVRGNWVRGEQTLAWNEHDEGSGLRFSRLKVDGATRGDGTIDYLGNGGCRIGYRDGSRQFGKGFTPCTQGPYLRYYGFNTSSITDGTHQLAICLQDYAQSQHGEESCDSRTIHTDNNAPGKPASLGVTSANPARYLKHFSASWSLPPNSGSPIAKVHYDIVNSANEVVVPARTVSANNPTSLADIEGPDAPGPYTLRLWLEDQVGLQGASSQVAIPHDTVPPAAPQDLHVTGPTTAHWVDKLDVAWHDITDEGSPITAAHYQLQNAQGEALGPAQSVSGEGIAALKDVQAPAQRGPYTLSVWLSDQEGNMGAPASVALPLDTTPPAAPQNVTVAPTTTSRSQEALDVHWQNITDDGSPIAAVHYQVLDSKGAVSVPTQSIAAPNVSSIAALQSPKLAGTYSLRMWLSDAEGNAGAPATVPLSYRCVRAETDAASSLSAGLGASSAAEQVVKEGEGSTLHGTLKAPDGKAVPKTPVCVFSRVITDQDRDFLGYAVTGPDGSYSFSVGAGASRELDAVQRTDHRELQSHATLQTVVHPTFTARRRVIYNKRFARFKGQIPGPHNDRVVIVLQARVGKGWTAFRRYRTRQGGRFNLAYRFRHTFQRTRYVMRAQVRQTVGYPYLQGNSSPLKLMVLPSGKHPPKSSSKRHCAKPPHSKKARRAKRAHTSRASHPKKPRQRRRGCRSKRRHRHHHHAPRR